MSSINKSISCCSLTGQCSAELTLVKAQDAFIPLFYEEKLQAPSSVTQNGQMVVLTGEFPQ